MVKSCLTEGKRPRRAPLAFCPVLRAKAATYTICLSKQAMEAGPLASAGRCTANHVACIGNAADPVLSQLQVKMVSMSQKCYTGWKGLLSIFSAYVPTSTLPHLCRQCHSNRECLSAAAECVQGNKVRCTWQVCCQC